MADAQEIIAVCAGVAIDGELELEITTEVCASCSRDNEQEAADLWCHDCIEPLCKPCGKAHRRFAVPHDVINITDVSFLSKTISNNCNIHMEQNRGLFCISHDQIICHQCLSEYHKSCANVVPLAKAAENVKKSRAIQDLTRRMQDLKKTSRKVYQATEKRKVEIKDQKRNADLNIAKLEECLIKHLHRIKNDSNKRHAEILEKLNGNSQKLQNLLQTLEVNTKELEKLKECLGEHHLFKILKYLDSLHLKDERSVMQMKNDTVTEQVEVMPFSFISRIDATFSDMNPIKPLREAPDTIFNYSKYMQSQVQQLPCTPVRRSTTQCPSVHKANDNCTFNVCCFTEDNDVLVVESRVSTDAYRVYYNTATSYFLTIFNLSDTTTKSVELDRKVPNYVCMYDSKLALVAAENNIIVVDIDLMRKGRVIEIKLDGKRSTQLTCFWVTCKNGKIWVLLRSENRYFQVCNVDFNGVIVSAIKLEGEVSDIDFDGTKTFYCTFVDKNNVNCISVESQTQSIFYSVLDLRENCKIQIADHLYILEKESNTIYKLELKGLKRSVLLKEGIVDSSRFCLNKTKNKIAIIVQKGKCIKVFNLWP